jgi:hypothetical protein
MSAGLAEAMAVLSRRVEQLKAQANAVCEALHSDIAADEQRRAEAGRREALADALIEQRLAAQQEMREQEKRRYEARCAIADAKEAEQKRKREAKKSRGGGKARGQKYGSKRQTGSCEEAQAFS